MPRTRYRIHKTGRDKLRTKAKNYVIQDTDSGSQCTDTRYKILSTIDKIQCTGYRVNDIGYRIHAT